MRADARASERFPQDVLELQGFLSEQSIVEGVEATPGQGTNVPLYILGSSLFGARLAAALGLPFAFASHFAPAALLQAVAIYRDEFQPSAQLATPYVIAAVNAVVADTESAAAEQLLQATRLRVARFLVPDLELSDEDADALIASPQGRQITSMMRYTACGSPQQVGEYLQDFAKHAHADELIVAHSSPTLEARLRSVDLLAQLAGLAAA
ncbi:unannotated protein [freshwater metagenome]